MEEKERYNNSKELVEFMVLNTIQTVEELVLLSDEVLVDLNGFGWHLLKEILFLRKIQ
ncbi:hypothetical protein ACFQZF_10410 [Flavobacterium myungsuense]|uniref:Uncharacterized protein n=1 Tax=Flavobacterium myungsuense TaxID=651823 RepID=A0ABW3J2V4_9FLAO